ncbi:MAG: hypothetical protein ACK5LP_10335 [Campylobacteraceae bacterium]
MILRKASFKEVTATKHSSRHNARVDLPKYLLPTDEQNYYKHFYGDDEKFVDYAQKVYLEENGQRMQAKQKNSLIKETVLNLADYHDEKDVMKLFQAINKEFGGHSVIEISIHRDEGHFEDKSDGLSFSPNVHILQKDGKWYVTKDLRSGKRKEDFCVEMDINKLNTIYNYHAHVKYSRMDISNGKTPRLTKNDISRILKFSAEFLGLAYVPDEKINSGNAVKDIKKQHDLRREVILLKRQMQKNGQTKEVENNNFIEKKDKKEEIENYSFSDIKQQILELDIDSSERKKLHKINSDIKKTKDYTLLQELNKMIEDLKKDFRVNTQEEKEVEKNTVQDPREVIEKSKKKIIGTIDQAKLGENLQEMINQFNLQNNKKRGFFGKFMDKVFNFLDVLKNKIIEFIKENHQLREIIEKLTVENKELKDKLGENGQNTEDMLMSKLKEAVAKQTNSQRISNVRKNH